MTAFVACAAEVAKIPEQAKFFLSGAIELATAVVLRVLELGEPTLEAAARYKAFVWAYWESDEEITFDDLPFEWKY